jgi:hypothetical protein
MEERKMSKNFVSRVMSDILLQTLQASIIPLSRGAKREIAPGADRWKLWQGLCGVYFWATTPGEARKMKKLFENIHVWRALR